MIKVFTANENGKIEFTKDELDALLKEAYEEGKKDGEKTTITTPNYSPWTYPSYPIIYTTGDKPDYLKYQFTCESDTATKLNGSPITSGV